jgi:serine protease
MKRIYFLISLLLLIASTTINAQETNCIPGDIIAMVHTNDEAAKLVSTFQTLNGVKTNFQQKRILSNSMHIYLFHYDISVINADIMLNAVKTNPNVILAQFNHIFKKRSIPNDSLFLSQQWNMYNTAQTGGIAGADIKAPQAWDITTGGLTAQGDTIVVAVIDDGFDLTHHDLNFWKNHQEIPGDSIDNDGNGYVDDVDGWNGGTNNDVIYNASHGTHVSGIVGARGNNISGVTGVNQNVKIMPICYGNAVNDTVLESNAIVAYAYARDQRNLYNQTNGLKGAFVVATNSSFGVDYNASHPYGGIPANYPMWCAMYDSLGLVGILSAAATANANWDIDVLGDIPTACASRWLVTVTNTDANDLRNAQAAYGHTTIDLGAPGTSITSTVPPNTYAGGGSWTGTSMASPHVAGAIALMYSVPCSQFIADAKQYPASMALIVKDSLLKATDPNTDLNNITVSGGRLNVFKAVKSIQNYCLSPSSSVGIADNGTTNADLNIKNIYPNPAANTVNIAYCSNQTTDIVFANLLDKK